MIRLPHRRSHALNRRDFLRTAGSGCGMLALAGLLAEDNRVLNEPAETIPSAVSAQRIVRGESGARPPHFPAKAKSVIWLFMEGGPSGFDLFDPKPDLQKRAGQTLKGIETHFGSPGPLMASPYKFTKYGQSGAFVCEKYSTLAKHVDDIAFVKSCQVESPSHAPAMYEMNTGFPRTGYPSAGAWVTYGLGSENRNLPGFIVLPPGVGRGGADNWSAGFLPASYQGTVVRAFGSPIYDIDRPSDLGANRQRSMLDLASRLNNAHAARHPGDSELEARIATFELAFRMQMEAPDALDLSRETQKTLDLYGIKNPAGGTTDSKTELYGRKCLMARRLVERGVRFVQVYSDGDWDAHAGLEANHTSRCGESDVPIAGLMTDLKRLGLLESTLVIWGGEFGRMPVTQGANGRDHNPYGFLMWMAGGGVKGGISYGETDEIGYKVAGDPVPVHDIHATILHLLGLDHKRLTYRFNGRDFRLTDVSGNVVTKILA